MSPGFLIKMIYTVEFNVAIQLHFTFNRTNLKVSLTNALRNFIWLMCSTVIGLLESLPTTVMIS